MNTMIFYVLNNQSVLETLYNAMNIYIYGVGFNNNVRREKKGYALQWLVHTPQKVCHNFDTPLSMF